MELTNWLTGEGKNLKIRIMSGWQSVVIGPEQQVSRFLPQPVATHGNMSPFGAKKTVRPPASDWIHGNGTLHFSRWSVNRHSRKQMYGL